MTVRPRPQRAAMLVALAVTAAILPSCGGRVGGPAPGCRAGQRLAIVAQSVRDAAYVPCVADLQQGWATTGLDVRRGSTTFSAVSDRAAGRVVTVRLAPSCDISGATAVAPRADGVRTYLALRSVSPRYAGTLFDVFAGGCVSYRFDFERGRHIALMDELQKGLGLFSRRQLRFELHEQLGVELDP